MGFVLRGEPAKAKEDLGKRSLLLDVNVRATMLIEWSLTLISLHAIESVSILAFE